MSSPFVVPVPASDAEPCAFESVLPNRDKCPLPGIHVDLLIYILSFFKPNPKITVSPAFGYELTGNPENGTSVLDQLLSGRADISPPYMELTYERVQKLPFCTPLGITRTIYVYRDTKDVTVPDLNLLKYLPNSYRMLGIFLFCFFVLLVCLEHFFSHRQVIWRNLKNRLGLVLALSLTILLGCLQTHLVMKFNLPPQKITKPIRSLEDLYKAIETKEYTALVNAKLIIETLFNNTHYARKSKLFKNLIEAAKINEPKYVSSMLEAERLILGQNEIKYVLLYDSTETLPNIVNNCELYMKEDEQYAFGRYSIFMKPTWKLRKTLKWSEVRLIETKRRKLVLKKYRTNYRANCSKEGDKSIITRASISIVQIQGLMWLFVLLFIASFVFFCLEFICNRKRELRAVRGRLTSEVEFSKRSALNQLSNMDSSSCEKATNTEIILSGNTRRRSF